MKKTAVGFVLWYTITAIFFLFHYGFFYLNALQPCFRIEIHHAYQTIFNMFDKMNWIVLSKIMKENVVKILNCTVVYNNAYRVFETDVQMGSALDPPSSPCSFPKGQ